LAILSENVMNSREKKFCMKEGMEWKENILESLDIYPAWKIMDIYICITKASRKAPRFSHGDIRRE
jgi:hypothetical protein